ncbi:MAG: STM3941 family protein [Planctomycetota bacterium]
MSPDKPAGVTIPLGKRKIAFLILGSTLFVAASIFLWSIAEGQQRFFPLLVKSAAVAGVLFFSFCGVYGCFKLFDNRPGLIIDDEGIVDNSSAIGAGMVPWDEVVVLRISEISGQRFITVVVENPEKYAARGNALSRLANSANTRMTGSPINISANSLNIKFDELVQAMMFAFGEYQRGVAKED